MCQQRDVMEKMKATMELMKTEALADKTALINLQSDLLKSKEEQLTSLKSAVQTTVQSTVQQEIKSYSAAVKANSSSS